MDIVFNHDQVLAFLKYFYTLVPARVCLFDTNGTELVAYPSSNCEYCNLIFSTAAGAAACQSCDRAAFACVKSKTGPYHYQCHAGLTELIVPITANSDKPVGYLMFGQVRTADALMPDFQHILDSYVDTSVTLQTLENAYHNIAVVNAETIEACMNILQACAAFIWLDEYIRLSQTPLSQQIQHYISDHLCAPLSLVQLADHFQIGKTTLCQTIRQDFDMSVNQLITKLRVEEAARLLRSEQLSISEIAAQVGIPDFNYFSKVFKKVTNLSPTAYRKQHLQ